MGQAFEWASSVPAWVWSTIVCAGAHGGLLALLFREVRSAERWKRAARVASEDARIWQSVAEHAEKYGAWTHGKRTVVAPQFHSPRSASSSSAGG